MRNEAATGDDVAGQSQGGLAYEAQDMDLDSRVDEAAHGSRQRPL